MNPRYIEWDHIGLCGIAGKSGSGKSSTMRLLLAQLAMGGAGLIVIDGHGKYGQQTLSKTIEPLKPSFLFPVAVEDEDIYQAIRAAYQIATWRKENWNESHEPPRIALIIDELANILMRFDGERSKFIVKALTLFATEARKTNVKTFVAAQNWTADFIGSASVRKSMNTLILHRIAPDEVSKFSNILEIRRSVPNMRVGEAWIIPETSDPQRVYIPKITQDDLLSIAHQIPPYEVTEDVQLALYGISNGETISEINHVRNNDISAPQSTISGISNDAITPELLQKWYYEILKYDTLRYTKTDIIYRVWGAMPGATKKYRAASKIYDYLKSKL